MQNSQKHDDNHETGAPGAHEGHGGAASHGVLIAVATVILLLLLVYGFLVSRGIPQKWTEISNAVHGAAHAEHDHEHDGHDHENGHDHGHDDHEHGEAEATAGETSQESRTVDTEPTDAAEPAHAAAKHHPPYWMIIPFASLLLCIAILPLIPATEHWWESNMNRFLVAAVLGFLTLCYYYFACDFPVELHWPGHAVVDPLKDNGSRNGLALAWTVFLNAIVGEYIAFIVLLFSLFTISGGIRIAGDLKATPKTNAIIILIGSVIASVVGTTGAAMLLIRLLLETNKQRKFKVHTIIVFIFCVCNCGGCLTPLGDPPLFLGYLRGVAFTWTLGLYVEWMFVNLILIAFYFLWDTIWFYPKESREDKLTDVRERTSLSISGWQLNLPLLAGVVAAVAFLAPGKTVPGTDWYPWFFLREAVQLALCAISLYFGSKTIRKENSFSFGAIGEVAALFFGIFICMQAPLQILNVEGPNLVARMEAKTGIEKTKLFFWATGSLSSVLDNAPTYVVFFETAKTLTPNSDEELHADLNEDGSPKWVLDNTGKQWKSADGTMKLVHVGNGYLDHYLLVAVALGSVFMGAMTYIGNGPNFMVKAIAEQSGVKMPSFFGYIVYSCFILLPILIVMTLIFL